MSDPAPSLARLLPGVAGALEADGFDVDPALGLGRWPRVCTVLVDGLGARLLAERGGHAPALRRAAQSQPDGAATELRTTVPSTTATALATLGTGCHPAAHGLVGYRAFRPGGTGVVNHLTWPADVDPEEWQPHPTVFERVLATGVPVTMVGPKQFAGSGLTRAALRGPRYVAAESLDARVAAAARALRATPRAMVNVYWGDVDKTGHARGCGSHEWAGELERIDAGLAALRRLAPADAVVLVTADHGMVDCPPQRRLDVAEHPHLREEVLATAGEPRLVQLRTGPGAAERVAGRWADALAGRAEVRVLDSAVAAGWLGGEPGSRVRARVGDVLVAAHGDLAVVDSERDEASLLGMVGQHGSVTDVETAVPLLRLLP
ncbi:alkaline phosphatase family protein [Aquipuribacter nitratireducens]|uniref:Alkaline phosphatase family protein n=1 Tax=Aquipuribacter nitratireducens TaxID=650104 RepID=A0ABW0GIJ5_9MICO